MQVKRRIEWGYTLDIGVALGITFFSSLSPDIQTLGERYHLNIFKNHAMLLLKYVKIMVNFKN